MYNSSAYATEDDSDITIISPSIIHEKPNEYVPIITRLKQANHSSENRQLEDPQFNKNITKNTSSESRHDYVIVDNSPQENAKNIEQILKLYIHDLTQETNTQLDCDKQLVVRLLDYIRPAYTYNQIKLVELNAIQCEVATLHDQRHIDQQEKLEQLRTELHQVNKMFLDSKNETLQVDETTGLNSVVNICNKRNSTVDYEQWIEIEDDTKKLHQIIKSQQHKIDEIVNLISDAAMAQTSTNPAEDVNDNTENHVSADTEPKPANSSTNFINTLLQKIRNINTESDSSTNDCASKNTLENHSPGASPTHSLCTLTVESLKIVSNTVDKTESNVQEKNNDRLEPIHQEPIRPEPIHQEPIRPEPIREELPKIVDDSVVVTRKPEEHICPVCNEKLISTSDDEIYDHIETCLFPPRSTPAQPAYYECPYCNRKLPGDDERTYLQHLSDCINRD